MNLKNERVNSIKNNSMPSIRLTGRRIIQVKEKEAEDISRRINEKQASDMMVTLGKSSFRLREVREIMPDEPDRTRTEKKYNAIADRDYLMKWWAMVVTNHGSFQQYCADHNYITLKENGGFAVNSASVIPYTDDCQRHSVVKDILWRESSQEERQQGLERLRALMKRKIIS
jgi:hypothetical protein